MTSSRMRLLRSQRLISTGNQTYVLTLHHGHEQRCYESGDDRVRIAEVCEKACWLKAALAYRVTDSLLRNALSKSVSDFAFKS